MPLLRTAAHALSFVVYFTSPPFTDSFLHDSKKLFQLTLLYFVLLYFFLYFASITFVIPQVISLLRPSVLHLFAHILHLCLLRSHTLLTDLFVIDR